MKVICYIFIYLYLPEVKHSPWKVTFPIGKDRLPTTILQGRAVKLRGFTYMWYCNFQPSLHPTYSFFRFFWAQFQNLRAIKRWPSYHPCRAVKKRRHGLRHGLGLRPWPSKPSMRGLRSGRYAVEHSGDLDTSTWGQVFWWKVWGPRGCLHPRSLT